MKSLHLYSLPFFLFLTIVATTTAQSSQQSQKERSAKKKNYTKISLQFDELLAQDSTDIRITDLNESSSKKIPHYSDLVYDSKKEYDYDFVRNVFCSPTYPEANKLNFLTALLNDGRQVVFHSDYTLYCKAAETQPELQNQLRNHYKKISTNDNGVFENYLYLDFVSKHHLSDKYELLKQYFEIRAIKPEKWINEYLYPLHIASKGRIEEAISLTRLLVEDVVSGEKNYIATGNHQEKSELFTYLYFSADEQQKKKILDLAFTYFDSVSKLGFASALGDFLEHASPDRYQQSIQQWLNTYESGTSEYDKRVYLSVLTNYGIPVLAQSLGYAYFKKFIESKSRWEDSNRDYDENMLRVAEYSMMGIDDATEQQNLLQQVASTNVYLKPENVDLNSRQFYGYIRLLRVHNPDLTASDMESTLPSEYAKHPHWRKILDRLTTEKLRDIDEYYSRKPGLSFESRLGLLQKHQYLEDRIISEYDEFNYRNGCHDDCQLLMETGSNIRFDTEGCVGGRAYEKLFDEAFRPVFRKNGLEFINIFESESSGQNNCSYHLNVANKNKLYSVQFEDCSDWFQTKPFVNAINIALRDSGTDKRLIFVDTGDQTTELMLSDPNQFVPLATELSIKVYAVSSGSGALN